MIRSVIVQVAPGQDLEAAAGLVAAEILETDDPSRHPDYEVFRSPGNVFGVDLVEPLVARAVLAPVAGPFRVFAVLEPERMLPAGANLLLKTLEEPPPSLHLLFVTSRPFDLPDTVRSRCAVHLARSAGLRTAVARGLVQDEEGRLGLAAGSGAPEALGGDDEGRDLLEAWMSIPTRVGPVPRDCLDLPDPIRALTIPPTGDDESRRRERRVRTDGILAGLSVLAWTYREAMAVALGHEDDHASHPRPEVVSGLALALGVVGCLEAIRLVTTARDAVLANGSSRLALEALCLRLGALGRRESRDRGR